MALTAEEEPLNSKAGVLFEELVEEHLPRLFKNIWTNCLGKTKFLCGN